MSDLERCAAYQVSDQMTCPRCRLTWDVNDPEPPACRPVDQYTVQTGKNERAARAMERRRKHG